jgi:hypothetical protein
MKLPAIIPGPAQIGRETLTVLAGALLAAWIVGNVPQLRAWIRHQWIAGSTTPIPPP